MTDKERIVARHGHYAEHYASSALDRLKFTEGDSVGMQIKEAIRLAILDGALREFQRRD